MPDMLGVLGSLDVDSYAEIDVSPAAWYKSYHDGSHDANRGRSERPRPTNAASCTPARVDCLSTCKKKLTGRLYWSNCSFRTPRCELSCLPTTAPCSVLLFGGYKCLAGPSACSYCYTCAALA